MLFNSLPVNAPLRVTSKYGKRNTGIQGASTFHKGVDLGRDFSKPTTEILSVSSGSVKSNYWNDYRGWVVIVDHGEGIETLYQHLAEQSPLLVGTRVAAGQVLGAMGNSSNPSKLKTATHLHFELRVNGECINPLPYLENIVPDEVESMTKAELEVLIDEKIVAALNGNGAKAPSKWAKESWEGAVEKGIVDSSKPKAYATREMVVQILKNAGV